MGTRSRKPKVSKFDQIVKAINECTDIIQLAKVRLAISKARLKPVVKKSLSVHLKDKNKYLRNFVVKSELEDFIIKDDNENPVIEDGYILYKITCQKANYVLDETKLKSALALYKQSLDD